MSILQPIRGLSSRLATSQHLYCVFNTATPAGSFDAQRCTQHARQCEELGQARTLAPDRRLPDDGVISAVGHGP